MIWFYRDFLDGLTYVTVAILALIFIMAIIGFIMERLQLERDEKNRTVVLQNEVPTVPTMDSTSTEQNDLDTTQTIVPEEIIQKSENAATNDAVPEVLDLNKVDESVSSS